MMKRWIAVCLAVLMAASLCATTAFADVTVNEENDYGWDAPVEEGPVEEGPVEEGPVDGEAPGEGETDPEQLPVPADLRLEGSVVRWTDLPADKPVLHYEVSAEILDAETGEWMPISWKLVERGAGCWAFPSELYEDWGEREYRFVFQVISNGASQYVDSPLTQVGSLYYQTPENKLDDPQEVCWDTTLMTWEPVTDGSVACYEVYCYYEDTGYVRYCLPGEFPRITVSQMNQLGPNAQFEVRAISADVNAASDSDWVVSTGQYTLPGPLPAPVNLKITRDEMTWEWFGDEDLMGNSYVRVYYGETENAVPELVDTVNCGQTLSYSWWLKDMDRSGWYYFDVMVETQDYSIATDSPWSEMSEGFYYQMPQRLPKPQNVTLTGSTIRWEYDEETELADHVRIETYYRRDESQEWNSIAATHRDPGEGRWALSSSTCQNRRDGAQYKFVLFVRSNDLDLAFDSETVEVGPITYHDPGKALPMPQNPRWDGITMKWDAVTDGSVYEYWVKYFDPQYPDTTYTVRCEPGTFPKLHGWALEESDTYHFRVGAITGDVNAGYDSDWAVCTETCTLPDPLPTPTHPTISDDKLTWNWTGDLDQIYHFDIQLYYAANAEDTPVVVEDLSIDLLSYHNWEEKVEQTGWYFFKVRAYSADLTQANHSQWSVLSDGCYYQLGEPLGAPQQVTGAGTTLSWLPSADDSTVDYYRIRLYALDGEGERNQWGERHMRAWDPADPSTLRWAFPTDYFEDGWSYQMGVVACSDDQSVRSNSAEVFGPVFAYEAPEEALDEPTGLRWEGMTMMWDVPEDTSDIFCYEVEIFNAEYPQDAYGDFFLPGQFRTLNMDEIYDIGLPMGFKVRAIPVDANAYHQSEKIVCETVFENAEAQPLPEVRNLTFLYDGGCLTWDEVPGANGYEVEIWSATSSGELAEQLMGETTWWTSYVVPQLSAEWIGENEQLVFRVCALGDGQFTANSPWSRCVHSLTEPRKLGTPAMLEWNKKYERHFEGDTLISRREEFKGFMSWKRGLDQARYLIKLYEVNSQEPVWQMKHYFGSINQNTYFCVDDFIEADMPSGTYYFTVQALGDGVLYTDGKVATSGTWTYVNPGVPLPAPTNPRWEGRTMKWDAPQDMTYVYAEQGEVLYAPVQEGRKDTTVIWTNSQFDTEMLLDNEWIMDTGDGFYWFRVRALSRDITKYISSPWVMVAVPYDQSAVSDEVNAGLTDVVSTLPQLPDDPDEVTPEQQAAVEEAVAAVKDMDQDMLAAAMSADNSASQPGEPQEDGTLSMLTQLEESLAVTNGVTTGVSVSDLTSPILSQTFQQDKVEMVGAALNADLQGGNATLEIREPDRDALIPTQYFNAVQFSMHLTDAKNAASTMDADPNTAGQQLAVPVRITLPVPEHINPAFLVILHRIESTGTIEELRPHMELREDGVWYASFVVTSFSEFAMDSDPMKVLVEDGCLLAELNFNKPLDGRVLCAVYDQQGRMLAVTELTGEELLAGQGMVWLYDQPEAVHTVRLFQLNDDLTPRYDAIVLNLDAE